MGIDQRFHLPDGRKLGWNILGDPEGRPLFFFHGTPGSRQMMSESDPLAQIPGLRWILPDRPGYGLSDPSPGRTLLDWAGDVAALADYLGLRRFSVAGVSGGAPHACACAYDLGDRIDTTLLFACPSPANFPGATKGMAFANRLAIFLSERAPGIWRWLGSGQHLAYRKDPEGYLDTIARQMCSADQPLMQDPGTRRIFHAELEEAFRQSSEGMLSDGPLTMTTKPWGFPLSEISVPVHLWHGEEDILVTRAMAEHLAQEIPDCRVHFVARYGHLVTEAPDVLLGIREALAL